MAIWYRARSSQEIYPVEVEKETEKSVYVKGCRYLKDSSYEWIRPTREEAKAALVAYRQAQVDRARSELTYAEEHLLRAKNL